MFLIYRYTAPDGQYGVDISGSAISPENEDASIHFDRFNC